MMSAVYCQVRHGISQERVDGEKARFHRALEGASFSEQAAARFWDLHGRKLEAELFAQEHPCEWKLGVAHEGICVLQCTCLICFNSCNVS